MRRFNIVKMAILLPPHPKLQCSPKQNPSMPFFFVETDTLVLKFIWKCKGPRTAKTILKKKNTVGGLTLSDFKLW